MKRRDKKFIAMVTAVSLSFSLVLSNGAMTVKGGEISQGELKELLKEKIESYESKNSSYSKSNSFKDNSLDENKAKDKDPEEEIRVIVQLNEAPAIEGTNGADYTDSVKADEEGIKNSQGNVIEEAEKITGTQVRRSFGYLVNGFSISTKRKNVEALSKINGVKCVTEVRSYKTDMQYAKDITGVTNAWNDLGYKGEGMVVSIIDTGIDYRHKDLKNINTDTTKLKKSAVSENINTLGYGEYFSDKVPFGYNYADENTNVIDTGSMHGMHVAGIVAANAEENSEGAVDGIKGVAPQAQLLAMKVFTNNPGTSSAYDDDIIAAIEDSVKLGADVINMSLGSTSGFTDANDPENQAVQRATDAGVICVISAGNSATSTQTDSWSQPKNLLGLKDTSTVGSPSTAASSLSVASMENTNVTCSAFNYKTEGGVEKKLQYNSPAMKYVGGMNGKFELVDCNLGEVSDFDGKDLTGKIALIQRGGITFQEKYDNAIAKNAAGVIIYNHASGGDETIGMNVSNVKKPLISIGHSQGEEIRKLINDGDNKFNLDLSSETLASQNTDISDMSQYTSWGATSDLEFKPEVTAPGGDIYSLANNNSYQSMSGTSMAAPNTSGTEALIMQAVKKKYPSLSGSDLVNYVKTTAMNTAKPMIDKYDSEGVIPYSTRRQGAGLLQVENAINNNVLIQYKDGKGAAALKEVGNTTTFELKLTNYGDKAVTYNLKDEKVYGETVDDKNLIHEVLLNGSTAKFDRTSVTVESGSTATVKVTLNISDKEEIDRFVEGYLNFESTSADAPSLSVPFMGFYGDWSKENIIDIPNYEGSDSLIGVTGLVSKSHNLYGAYVKNGQEYIDNDRVAFSPNGDGVKDNAIPALFFLRNAKELKVEVLDSEGNVVRELLQTSNIRKNTLEDGFDPNILSSAMWDGTLYDSATGKYVKADDGQYTIRIKSKVELENAKEQLLDLPVKIDTAAPTAKIKGVEKYADEKGGNHYKLSWEAADNEGGSKIAPVYEVSVNGKVVDIESSKVTEVDGVYSTDIPFADGEVNNISVAVSDNAGNMTVAESKEKAESLKTVAISGLQDRTVIGEKDLKDGKFPVKGTAGDDLKILQINGKDVEFENNYFEEAIEVTDGENTIKVYAEDNDGNKVLDKEYKVILDRKNPEVTVKQNLTDKAPYYTTDNSELDLDVAVSDDTKCTVQVVNGDLEEDVTLNDANEGKAKIGLKNGLNKIQVIAVDEAGNKTIKEYLVMKGDSTGELTVKLDNLSVAQYFNKNDLKNGVYTVKGHASKKVDTIKINNEKVSVNDDLTFAYDLKVSEGRNMVHLYAEDTDGTVVADYSYKVYYDETAPKIELKDLIMRDDNKVYVNNADFVLNGVLKENLYGYYLYVNGERISEGDRDPIKINEGIEKPFSKAIKLVDGDNTIEIAASDVNGNTIEDKLQAVLDTVAPVKPQIKVSGENTKGKPVKVTVNSDEKQLDRIEYSTDGVNFVKYTGEFDVAVSSKVYARAVDYAGNVGEVSEADITIKTVKPEVTLNGVVDGTTYYEPVILTADVNEEGVKATILVNGKEYNGETLDVEGEYTVEAYAVDEDGIKSDVVKKTFKLAQNCIESTDGDMKVLKHNDIKPAGDNYLFESLTSDNVTLKVTDSEKGAVVVTPNVVVSMINDIVKANIKNGLDYTQKVYEDKDLLSSLNSIGKVFEMNLNNGKDIVDLGNDEMTVSFKLGAAELEGKDTSKLKAYIYDEINKEWKEVSGEFDNTNSTFTFKTNKLGKFTIAQMSGTEDPGVDIKPGVDNKPDVDNSKVDTSTSKGDSKFTSAAKTADGGIVFAGVAAAVAAVAGVIALVTGRKKEK